METHQLDTEQVTVLERSIVLLLSCKTMGNSRAVRGVELTKDGHPVEADKKTWRVRKDLLASKDVAEPRTVQENIRSYLRSMSIPSHRVFGPSTYLIPLSLIDQVNVRLLEMKADMKAKIEALVERWPELVEERRQVLGELFRADEYPTADDVRELYDVEWAYVSFEAPDKLMAAAPAAYRQAVEEHAHRVSAAYDEVVTGLRQAALIILQQLSERLEPTETGRRRTVLNDLEHFISVLPDRDMTNDSDLRNALTTVRQLTHGVTPDIIRSDDDRRNQIREAAEAAANTVGELVELGPRRAISFGEIS
jgi:hypothetical protein